MRDPYLSVCHYYVPIIYRSDVYRFSLIEDERFKNTLKILNQNKDFFMTCFVRTGNNGETIVGLQQKFIGTVPKRSLVSFKKNFHYRWTSSKQKVVTITHQVGDISSKGLYEGAMRLVRECESFLITHTKEGDELLNKLSMDHGIITSEDIF